MSISFCFYLLKLFAVYDIINFSGYFLIGYTLNVFNSKNFFFNLDFFDKDKMIGTVSGCLNIKSKF